MDSATQPIINTLIFGRSYEMDFLTRKKPIERGIIPSYASWRTLSTCLELKKDHGATTKIQEMESAVKTNDLIVFELSEFMEDLSLRSLKHVYGVVGPHIVCISENPPQKETAAFIKEHKIPHVKGFFDITRSFGPSGVIAALQQMKFKIANRATQPRVKAQLDMKANTLKVSDLPRLPLAPQASRLLHELAGGEICGKQYLLNAVRKTPSNGGTDKTVDMHLSLLGKSLTAMGQEYPIENYWGIGHRLAGWTLEVINAPQPPAAPATSKADKTDVLIAG